MTRSHARSRSPALLGGLIAAALFMIPDAANAKAACPAGFPSKPIRFVVGFGAGGGTDVIGRAVATGFEKISRLDRAG